MYSLEIWPPLDKILGKLSRKNQQQVRMIEKKIEQICENPFHEYKHLRKPLQNFSRVHIDTHFVIIFRIAHERRVVEMRHYAHHDDVYSWNPKLDNH